MGAGLLDEKAEAMKCALCRGGETTPGSTTETYEIDGSVVVVRIVVIQEYQAA
jgi:YgiT-type zinc finger domain-containing protein